MSTLNSFCLTCLSNLEEGAILTETLIYFLCDVLHFKLELLQESQKIICRKCYKTLIELKCFYTQLRDVEVYFESKFKINNLPNDVIEQDDPEESYISQLECTVSIAEDSKLDSIIIDEDEECCIVEDDNASRQNKTLDLSTGRRFVCLTCSEYIHKYSIDKIFSKKRYAGKLFSSVDDLRSHERTHNHQPIQKASPVFLAANSQLHQKITYPESEHELYNKIRDTHIKKNKEVKPFYCKSCKHRFSKKELLIYHESKYECMVCHIKCCSRSALEVHMKMKHNSIMNDSHGILESMDNKTNIDQQLNNNITQPK